MSLSLDLLQQADDTSITRLLDVHFAQGKLSADKPDAIALEREAKQRELAGEWLFQQKFQLAHWGKPEFQRLLNGLNQYLHKQGHAISYRLLAELQFSFLILDSLDKFNQLSADVSQRLFALRPILLAYSIRDKKFWFSAQSIKKLFDQLYQSGLGLDVNLGRQADATISLLQQFVDKAMVHPFTSTEALFALMQSYKSERATANTRLKRLLDRLSETEQGAMKSSFANKNSAQLLLDIAQDIKLPDHWVHFLLKSLRIELNVLIAGQGVTAKILPTLKQNLRRFIAIYHPDSQNTFNMNDAMNQSVALERQLIENFPNLKQAVEAVFATSAADLLQLEAGHGVTGVSQSLTEAGLCYVNADNAVSQLLLDKVAHTRVGQWFIYTCSEGSETSVQRVELLLKLDDIQQYLFVNANGQKVLSCDIEQFAALLSSQGLKTFSQDTLLTQTCEIIISKLLDKFDAAEAAMNNKQLAEQQEKEALKKQQLRQEAAHKARLEAKALAAEMERRSIKPVAPSNTEAGNMTATVSTEIIRKLRMAIDGLLIGSWIEVKDGVDSKQLKLAVKFTATNRFVFVNPEGITDREMQRDELVEAVMQKNIVIMETDQFFADRLNALLAQVEREQ